MKQKVKKWLIYFISKINLPHLITEVQNKQHDYFISLAVTNNGAVFHPEAIVSNNQDRSKIMVGKGTHIRGMLNVFKYGGRIDIGENCYIGDHSRIWSGDSITIGNFVQISHNVNVMDTNAHEIDAVERATRAMQMFESGAWADKGNVLTAPVIIKDYAWICFNASILKGVTIGEGAIVAANAVVVKDVPAYTMVAGNPAKMVKNLHRP